MAERTRMIDIARRAALDCAGSAAVEYGIVTLIGVAVLLAINAIGGNINSIFQTIASAFN